MYKLAVVIAACMGILVSSSAMADKRNMTGRDWKSLEHVKQENLARQVVKIARPSLNRQQTDVAAEGVMTCMNSELSGDGWEQAANKKLAALLAYCLRITR
jgi:hypothetical protein